MAILAVDNYEVGVPYIVPPVRPTNDLVVFPGNYEFRPRLSPQALTEALLNGEISSSDDYIATYQSFSLSVEAIPNLTGEGIIAHRLEMSSCVLEEPLPSADPSRTGSEEGVDIPITPYWTGLQFMEPTVVVTGGPGSIATVSGYFSERNFYDREWVLQYDNGIARFTSEGITYSDDSSILRSYVASALSKTLSSSINVNSFYPITISAAQRWGPEIMQGYIEASNAVISYKPSEIKKLRFYLSGEIQSTTGLYPYTAHITVQVNQKYAEQRLDFALNRRTIGGLLPI